MILYFQNNLVQRSAGNKVYFVFLVSFKGECKVFVKYFVFVSLFSKTETSTSLQLNALSFMFKMDSKFSKIICFEQNLLQL